MQKFIIALGCLLISCTQSVKATPPIIIQEEFASSAPPAPPAFRLPKSARPIRYNATLQLVPNQDTFTGEIDIDLEFVEKTSVLWLNASQLTIKSAQLKTGQHIRTSPVIVYETPSAKGSILSPTIVSGGDDFVGFDFGRELAPGKATLHVSYEGVVSRQDESGIFQQEEAKRWYIFTQFEATDARRAFPCFDEPEFKTPWSISIQAPEGEEVFGNTPVLREKKIINDKNPLKPLREIVFQETKPLPSYLISFAVGPFDVVEVGKIGKNKTPARIITPKGRAAWAEYAAKNTEELLVAIEDYTGIPYPFEKLDQIAIPRFSGAMENAGLITYGHNLLLAEPGKDTITRQRDFMLTAAHEIGHHWFGNLVTMLWWDDLWLNESFAEWIMGRVMVDLRPGWQMLEETTTYSLYAKSADSVLSAPKIRHKIESKADINDAFDGGITYAKGQAILTMFEYQSLGPDKFKERIQKYLKEYSFKNATFDDFLRAMADSPSEAKGMRSFIDQPGVPLVSASLVCDKKGAPKVSLKQSRYFTLGSKEASSTPWDIRVCLRYKGTENAASIECVTLSSEKMEHTLTKMASGCPTWLNLNGQARGYYYSGYSKELLQKNFTAGFAGWTTAEVMLLLADVQAMVDNGSLSFGDALSIVAPLAKEKDRFLTDMLVDFVASAVERRLVPAELRPNFARLVRAWFGERAKGLGFTLKAGLTEDEILLQKTLIKAMAFYGDDKGLQEEAKKLSYAWLKSSDSVHPEFVDSVLSLGAKYGDEALFEAFLQEAKRNSDRRVRDRLFSAMGRFQDQELSARAFALVTSQEFVLREAMRVLWAALNSDTNGALAYQFVTKNFEQILKQLPADGAFRYGANLPYFGGVFCDTKGRAEVEGFFAGKMKSYEGGEIALEEVLESIDICIAFSAKQKESLAALLQKM